MRIVLDIERYSIGIDLGKTGGIAVFSDDSVMYGYWPMPPTESAIVDRLITLYEGLLRRSPRATISTTMEMVHAMPGEGVSSVATFANHSGGVYGACVAISKMMDRVDLPLRILPSEWKKHFGLIDAKASKYEKKKMSVDYVNKEYYTKFKYVDNGITDAILIARYMVEKKDDK